MKREDLQRFANLTFEDFRTLATDRTLTPYEKIGFPNEYREGKEEAIFADIVQKLSVLTRTRQIVLDIGPGCSGLSQMIVKQCREKGHTLIAIDSPEMLEHLPNEPFITKILGPFPSACSGFLAQHKTKVDAILVYSVFHYVYAEANPFHFVDKSLELLKEGGQMLIGDVPNISKRKRFFSSVAGIQFHQEFTQTNETPRVQYNKVESAQIDDAVILGVMHHCQAAGFDTYLLPQPPSLPMSNRRDDLLISRP